MIRKLQLQLYVFYLHTNIHYTNYGVCILVSEKLLSKEIPITYELYRVFCVRDD